MCNQVVSLKFFFVATTDALLIVNSLVRRTGNNSLSQFAFATRMQIVLSYLHQA